MKIGIDARFLSSRPTGIGEYCEHLITSLAGLDTENEYFVLVHSSFTRSLNVGENFRIAAYEANPVSSHTLYRLHRFLEKQELHLFHSLFPLAPLFFKGEIIVTVHDIQPFLTPYMSPGKKNIPHFFTSLFYQWMYPHVLKRADWLIAVSEATKNYMIELFPAIREKIVVIHSGISEEWFGEPVSEQARQRVESYELPERYILYEGGCRPSKNVRNMLRGFSIFARERQDLQNIHFVLALQDDGYLENIKQHIKSMHLGKQVRIITGLNDEELKILYKNALLLLFVTKYEGFGFPVLQAQSVGTPVIASTSAALPEVVRNSAILAEPNDINQIGHAIICLLTDQSLYQDLVRRGTENVKKYSWNNTARLVLEMYKHLT